MIGFVVMFKESIKHKTCLKCKNKVNYSVDTNLCYTFYVFFLFTMYSLVCATQDTALPEWRDTTIPLEAALTFKFI